MAAAAQRAPIRPGTADEVRDVRHDARRRQREPVAQRLADAGLLPQVFREMRERVALRVPLLVADVFVAAGERDRLERDEADLVAVRQRELDDRPDLIVVDGVDDGHHEADIDPGGVQVLDGAELHIEQVANLAVRVGLFADTVELEVRNAHAGVARLAREVGVLREPDAVGGGLNAEVADLARVADGVEEDRRDRRLAA